MFCTSIRSRPDISSLIPTLSSPSSGLRETTLQGHDLSLPLPSQPPPLNNPHRPHGPNHLPTLHILLLTPLSLNATHRASTVQRIDRLSTLAPSRALTAVIFILSLPSPGPSNPSNTSALEREATKQGFAAYIELQVLVQEMPNPPVVLPVPRTEILLQMVGGYMRGLASTVSIEDADGDVRRDLLAHVTSSAPTHPLSEHTTFLLGDITHSLADVVTMATTGPGKRMLGEYLEERDVSGISEFWEEEWIAE